MTIGKIVKSNTHADYVCQVYNPGDIESSPSPENHAIGTFVRLALDDHDYLVGLVYDTILVNPEYAMGGPRLSPPHDLQVFSPDLLQEQVTMVGIMAIGQVTSDGVQQGLPRLAATVGAMVEKMTPGEVRAFHQTGDGLTLAYAPLLLAQSDPLIPHLLLNIVHQLDDLFPDQARQLAMLRGNLAWKTVVAPAG